MLVHPHLVYCHLRFRRYRKKDTVPLESTGDSDESNQIKTTQAMEWYSWSDEGSSIFAWGSDNHQMGKPILV
ncbi:hypothetical protein ABKV19_017610 [Rosa sericea]